jgi:hypothetical protein
MGIALHNTARFLVQSWWSRGTKIHRAITAPLLESENAELRETR